MKLIILNGPPGVGKSTVAGRLHQEIPSSVLIDVDEIRRMTMPDWRERRKESLSLAFECAADAVEDGLRGGHDVIIEKAIFDAPVIDSFVEIGKKYQAEVYEFLLFADKTTVLRRADERGYNPGGLLTPERAEELWEKSDKLRPERTNAFVVDTTLLTVEEVFNSVKKALVRD